VTEKAGQKVHVITMGCAKNTVDSEKLLAQLGASGVELTADPAEADITVINTCGFIDAAREESVDTIIENVRFKAGGTLKKVYAVGCLVERYRDTLKKEIPEVDGFFGTAQLPAVVKELGGRFREELLGERLLTTPSHVAYLKISEGCDNPCSFCSIPLMRGKHVSRPADDILRETELLASKGVREIVVIGQDTTNYGVDLHGKRSLAGLLTRIADVPGIAWVRLMYAYPAKFPLDVLDVIAGHPGLCKYLDMPVQHVSDTVLRSMRRGISRRAMLGLIETIQQRVPGIALRTTLIVGYPDETEQEFSELLSFVRAARFARLGVFTYSQEESTTAWGLGDPVPAAVKEHRQAAIMEAQQEISEERNAALVGSNLQVLIDRREDGLAVGRTECDAPEIDNEVYVTSEHALMPGSFVKATITGATEYDLYGTV
jgi:ribosomal protein S12 methylthiotransferase